MRLLIPLTFALLMPLPLAAQDDDTIIVTGEAEPVTVRAVTRQARDIAVQQGNVYDVPLARFEDRLCPGVTGLTPDMAALCDVNVKIPMRGRADSLNLSVATGIMIYAATA